MLDWDSGGESDAGRCTNSQGKGRDQLNESDPILRGAWSEAMLITISRHGRPHVVAYPIIHVHPEANPAVEGRTMNLQDGWIEAIPVIFRAERAGGFVD
jgi:hypothetical protein